MKAREFDEAFDRGDDVTPYLDVAAASRPGLDEVAIRVPRELLEALEREAAERAMSCEALIRAVLAAHLEAG